MKAEAAVDWLPEDVLAALADALPATTPSPRLRMRLVDSLAGPDRFGAFFAELARRFDLSVDAVRALLELIDDPGAWEASPSPWIRLIHFSGGPAVAEADAGFVRVGAGRTFPRHGHEGPEMTFILEGRAIVGDRVFVPGDVVEVEPGHVHELVAGPERDLVVMVWHHGIVFIRV